MDNFGFIREKTDIKILILYILNRLPRPIDMARLTDLVMCDDAINYFEYAQALAELVKTEHVIELEDRYFISQKGIRDARETESDLPFTIRMKSQKAAERAAQVLNREAMLVARHSSQEDGGCTVTLSLSDKRGSILKLELLAGDEKYAVKMEKTFRENAESLYHRIVELLLEEG